MKHRLTLLMHTLTQSTVLEEWFRPMQAALDRVRYPDKVFATLTIPAFLLLGCLRQLQAHRSLREQVPSLMHIDNDHNHHSPVQPGQMLSHQKNGRRLLAKLVHIWSAMTCFGIRWQAPLH